MWSIDKKFDFCYGHRVWSQTLQEGYATDMCLACRHLHGHQGTFTVHLCGDELINGMVTDFKNLGWLKTFIDSVLDHKMILDINDPALFKIFPSLEREWLKFECIHPGSTLGYYIPDLGRSLVTEPEMREIFEGLVLVDFVPTSENLAKWIYDIVDFKMKQIGVRTLSVEFNETPKSRSIYSPN